MLQIKGQIPTQPSGHGPFMNESNSESHAMTRLVTTEEREQAVKLLTTAFAEDAIPVAEFERRVGSMELDLRRAEFPRGVTEIRVKAVLGNIEIELPDHVRVEHEGHALLAVFSVRGRSPRRESDDTPVVRITGRSILANVEVELDD